MKNSDQRQPKMPNNSAKSHIPNLSLNQGQLRHLPPLNALRAFEAAARHSNFRAAAEELNVTHSAISHQIKGLEEQLQIALFDRDGRRVRLSAAGANYYPVISDALLRIADGTRLLKSMARPDIFVLQTFITMATNWLLPRLHDFQARHPGIKIQLSTAYHNWDFDRQGVDAGIILSRNPDPDLHSIQLCPAIVTPLVHKSVMASANAPQSPEDLLTHTLVQHSHCADEWQVWADANGLPAPDMAKSILVDTYLVAFQTAESLKAIAMANLPFHHPTTELIEPFPECRTDYGHWYLTCHKEMAQSPKIQIFASWLSEQMEESFGVKVD